MRGVSGQTFNQAVTVFVHLVSVPVLLNSWGKELYGEWLVLSAIPMYLSMTDLGFSSAAIRDMIIQIGKGSKDGALKAFQSAWGFLLIISFFVIMLFLPAVFVLPIEKLLNISILGFHEIRYLEMILCLLILATLQTNLFYGGFACVGKYGLGFGVLGAIRLIENTGLLVCALLGGGVTDSALSALVLRIGGMFVMLFILKRSVAWLYPGFSYFDRTVLAKLFKPSLASLIIPLSDSFNLQGMRIIVGMIMGPSAVVVFATLRTLTRLVKMFLNSLSKILMPEIGMAYGNKDKQLMLLLHRKSCQISIGIALVSGLFLLIFGEGLLSIWTAGEVPMHQLLFAFLILVNIVNAFWFTSFNIQIATNFHARAAVVYLCVNISGLVMAWFAGLFFELNGVASVLLVMEITMIFYVVPGSLSLTSDNMRAFLLNLVTPPNFMRKVFVNK